MPTEGRALPGLGIRLASLAVVAALAAADQYTKAWAFAAIPFGTSRDILPPILSFTLSENKGIILGIGGSVGWVFTVTSFAMLAALLVILWRKPLPWPMRLALCAIASGALGNGLDRYYLKHVRDFIDLHYHGHVYPTFNVADSCICIGAGILALGLWRAPENPKHAG